MPATLDDTSTTFDPINHDADRGQKVSEQVGIAFE